MRIPLTVLWIDNCQVELQASFYCSEATLVADMSCILLCLQVTQVKLDKREGYTALQLGCGSKRDKQLNGRQIGHCKAAGVDNKRKLAEFRVSQDGILPVGHELNAAHFVPGQYLDIAGMTIGKGFQGVMKRHGFKGQPASHGNSLAHRAPGGIGACQDPGKVWPGKKMPGRMGNKRRTVQSAWLYKVCHFFSWPFDAVNPSSVPIRPFCKDLEPWLLLQVDPLRNLLYVRGQVPGHKGNFVEVKDAVMKQANQQPARPFPTYLGPALSDVQLAPPSEKDPFDYQDA